MQQDPQGTPTVPALGALFLVLVAITVFLLANAGLPRIAAWLRHETLNEASAWMRSELACLTMIQVAYMGATLWSGLRLFGSGAPFNEALSLRPIGTRTIGLALLSGALLQFPLTELSNVLHHHVFGPDPIETQLAIQGMLEAASLGRGVLVVLCVVTVVPFMEELLFRGLLLFGLRARYGDPMAVLASALLFGLAHVDPTAIVYATTAGIVLGVLALRTRSIWPGIAVHGAINAMPVLLPERALPLRGFNVPSVEPVHLPLMLVLPALILGLLLLTWVVKGERERL